MKTQIISIINNKGGVGKTTTTKMFQKILSNAGNKVLLIDSDAQGNLSDEYLTVDCEYSLYDLLLNDDVKSEDVILKYDDNTDIIKGDMTLQKAHDELMMNAVKFDPVTRLKDKLNNIINNEIYDYIIIDCPPSLSLVVNNVLAITTKVVIPIKADNYSITGIKMLMDRISDIKKRCNDDIEVATIFLNCFKNSNVHKEIFYNLKENLNMMSEHYVKDHAIVMRATFEKTNIEKHDVYSQFKNIVNQVVGDDYDRTK